MGRGAVQFELNGQPVRLNHVLYVPKVKENLLSTDALLEDGVDHSCSRKTNYRFMRNNQLVAKGIRIGRASYLDWVKERDALIIGPESVRRSTFYARLGKEDFERELMHQRCGHPGRKRLNNIMKELGLESRATEDDSPCKVCVKAKKVKSQNHVKVPRAAKPLQRIYVDFWGPYDRSGTIPGADDHKYYMSIVDDYSRYSWLYVTKDRTANTVRQTLETWLKKAERQTGEMLVVIRTDNAQEFLALRGWADGLGIDLEFTEPHTPAQNGPAERFNRIILEIVRALLFQSGLPKGFWRHAVRTANYLRNRTTFISDTGKSPYEMWFGHKPDLTKIRTWGCHVEYYDKSNDKLEPRTSSGMFVEYGKSHSQYLIMNPDGRLRIATNPVFFEQERGPVPAIFRRPEAPREPIATEVMPGAQRMPTHFETTKQRGDKPRVSFESPAQHHNQTFEEHPLDDKPIEHPPTTVHPVKQESPEPASAQPPSRSSRGRLLKPSTALLE